MTHDRIWVYHYQQEYGIEKANKINRAAIKSLAKREIFLELIFLELKN